MKIGIVTTWFERGAAIVSRQFMDVLNSQNHDVYIYARGGERFAKDDSKWDLSNVTWNPFLTSNIPTDISQSAFEHWIATNSIDVIIFNEQQFLSPVLWAKALGVPTIAYVDYYTKENIRTFNVYDQLWCNTKRHLSAFTWHPGAEYIPWGTDLALFRPDVAGEREYFFFHSAGMNPARKGTDLFVRALYRARDELQCLGRRSLLHTQVDLTKVMSHITPMVKELEDTQLLKVVTATIPAPGLYTRASVYVYPSRLEGIGLTLAEAAACGLYIVTTDEPPMSEFALSGASTLIPIENSYPREDGYFWDMVTPSVSSLSSILVGDFEFSPDSIRDAAQRHFDFTLNARSLTPLLNSVTCTPVSDLDARLIDEHDRTIGVFLRKRTKLNRFLFMGAKWIRRTLF